MSYLNSPQNKLFNRQTDPGLAIRKDRRKNQTAYTNPAFEMEQADLANKVTLINKITSADKAKALLKNKFFWIFIALALLVGIFFAVVYTVPQCNHLVCDSIVGADACTQCAGGCCAKCNDCGKC